MDNVSSGGIGVGGMLLVLFVALKLTGVINWPWVWVLAPAWIGLGLFLLILVVVLIIFWSKQ